MIRIAAGVLSLILAAAAGPDTAARAKASGLEVVASFGREFPPGNVAVTPQGRVMMSLHQFFAPSDRVVEVRPDGTAIPFPDRRWNAAPGTDGIGFANVLGIRSDGRGIVWMLDNGGPDAAGRPAAGRVVAWDSRAGRLHRVITLAPPAVRDDSFLNDLAVDPVHRALFIADTATADRPALIVVDLETGLARRVLEGHRSVVAEPIAMTVEGRTLTLGGAPAHIGVNPITIDAASEWVYFGAMTSRTLYRVRARDLLDPTLDDAALGARVERYGDKAISDGITVDTAGNVYITDITGDAIGVTAADGSYRVLYQDPALLRWPDAMAVGPDGWIYVVTNQLHRSPPLNGGEDRTRPPFHLLRFRPLAPAVVGR